MRQGNVTRLEAGVDNEYTSSWLWLFTQPEHRCLRQSHSSIHDDHTSDCESIADYLGRFLSHVHLTRFSFCGMWSGFYPLTITTLSFKFIP